MMSPLFQAWDALGEEYNANIEATYEKLENGEYDDNLGQFEEDIRNFGIAYRKKSHEVRNRYKQAELLGI